MSWFQHFFSSRKRAATIHSVYIADGFAEDCQELLRLCSQVDTLNFDIFSNIWKHMKFGDVFKGRISEAELVELSEEALQVAKGLLMLKNKNFEASVACLFLIYGLLNLQPLEGFAKLRLTPADVGTILHIEDIARQQKRQDVLYVLGTVLVKGPCEFHYGEREYGMDVTIRKYFEEITTIDEFNPGSKGVLNKQSPALSILRELATISKQYEKAKVFDGSGFPHPELRYTDPNMATNLLDKLNKLIDGEYSGTKAQQSHVQNIKHKAMWERVQEIRHLKQLPDGNTASKDKMKKRNPCDSPSASSSKASPSTGSISKRNTIIKKEDPKKPLATKSPKKKTFTSKSTVSTSSSDDDKLPSKSLDDDDSDEDSDEEDAAGHALNIINQHIHRFKNPNATTADNPKLSTSGPNLMTTSMSDANESEIMNLPMTEIKIEQVMYHTARPSDYSEQTTDDPSDEGQNKSNDDTFEQDLAKEIAQKCGQLPNLSHLAIASAMIEDDIISTPGPSTVKTAKKPKPKKTAKKAHTKK